MIIERQIVGSGQSIKVDPLDRIPDYDPRSGEHLWVVAGAWRVTPDQWTSSDPAVTPILDQENLLSVAGPGCYYCEAYYSPRLAKRRCPGESR